jgi:oxygen-independent coproporphyrinogen-3 oxidase
LNRGIDLAEIAEEFGKDAVGGYSEALAELVADGLIERVGTVARLTGRGRMISNEVFERFVSAPSHA